MATTAPSHVEKLISVRAVCEQLAISRPTLYKLVNRGELPKPVKIGAASRWPQSQITNFITDRMH